jgi:hypothetical protein
MRVVTGLACAKPDEPHGPTQVTRIPGARGTPDNQALGGLRIPSPSSDGKTGCTAMAKRTT